MTASLLAFGCVHVSVRMWPVRLALCDLEAPGWGEPWFPHCRCCFLAHRLLYGFFAVCCVALDFLAITIPEMIQCFRLCVRFRCELI
jgi:hypothetical protein